MATFMRHHLYMIAMPILKVQESLLSGPTLHCAHTARVLRSTLKINCARNPPN